MLQFRIQSTPNPNARKYILNQPLKHEGKVSYQTVSECQHVPMAAALLSVPGITQVHFFENVLTITQDGMMDWAFVDNATQNIVTEKMPDHDIFFAEHVDRIVRGREDMPPEVAKIDEILERTVRPGLQLDGGDIEPMDLEGNILTVRYMGACGGCPSSQAGTLEAIKMILREEYMADLEVVAI